eukprot:13138487-Ditylum_brightwellii.AAC.1
MSRIPYFILAGASVICLCLMIQNNQNINQYTILRKATTVKLKSDENIEDHHQDANSSDVPTITIQLAICPTYLPPQT